MRFLGGDTELTFGCDRFILSQKYRRGTATTSKMCYLEKDYVKYMLIEHIKNSVLNFLTNQIR